MVSLMVREHGVAVREMVYAAAGARRETRAEGGDDEVPRPRDVVDDDEGEHEAPGGGPAPDPQHEAERQRDEVIGRVEAVEDVVQPGPDEPLGPDRDVDPEERAV